MLLRDIWSLHKYIQTTDLVPPLWMFSVFQVLLVFEVELRKLDIFSVFCCPQKVQLSWFKPPDLEDLTLL